MHITDLFLLAWKQSTFVPPPEKDVSLSPTTHQHVKGDLLLLFVAPQWFNHIIFFTTTQLQLVSALCVKRLLERYCFFDARRKTSYQLLVKDTFLFTENVDSLPFTRLQALSFNWRCLWDSLRYLQRKSSLPQPFLSSANKLFPPLRQGRGTLCGSSRLLHVLVGHWHSGWLRGCLQPADSGPGLSHGLWRLWALHFTAGFHKTLLPGWFASLPCCISPTDLAPDQSHLATYPQRRDV